MTSEIILLIILVLMLLKVFWLINETRKLRRMIESFIIRADINKGGKNGGNW